MQAVFTLETTKQRGRPRKAGPPSELERERGRRVTAWIKAGIVPPHTTIELKGADVARITKLSTSAVQYLLNDCYDPAEDRMKLPLDDTLRKLAVGLGLDISLGKAAREYTPALTKAGNGIGIGGEATDDYDAVTDEEVDQFRQAGAFLSKEARHAWLNALEVSAQSKKRQQPDPLQN